MVDPLSAFFLILFGIGSLFTVLSFLLGVGHVGGLFHGHGGLDGHGHGGLADGPGGPLHGHGGQGEAGTADGGVSPLNSFTVAAFLIWFGAAGFLASRIAGWATPVGLAVALAGGLAAATIVFLFLARVLIPPQTVM